MTRRQERVASIANFYGIFNNDEGGGNALSISSYRSGSAAAHAQTTTTTTTTTDVKNSWRVSKLMGLDVYNDSKEKIGDISEVLIDGMGNVKSVVIGVGGFLGVGARDVAVPMERLKFSETSVNASSTTGSSASSQNDWAPDHAMMSTTKEQLQAMPEFKFPADT